MTLWLFGERGAVNYESNEAKANAFGVRSVARPLQRARGFRGQSSALLPVHFQERRC